MNKKQFKGQDFYFDIFFEFLNHFDKNRRKTFNVFNLFSKISSMRKSTSLFQKFFFTGKGENERNFFELLKLRNKMVALGEKIGNFHFETHLQNIWLA